MLHLCPTNFILMEKSGEFQPLLACIFMVFGCPR